MESYKLTATLGGRRRSARVTGDHRNMDPKIVPLFVHEGATEEEIADADASMSAMPIILNRAFKDEVWAKGRIVLAHSSGRIVKTMDAKGDA
jgi:hypothetical protein